MPVSCFIAGCDARVFQEIHQFIFIPETLYNPLITVNMSACFLFLSFELYVSMEAETTLAFQKKSALTIKIFVRLQFFQEKESFRLLTQATPKVTILKKK